VKLTEDYARNSRAVIFLDFELEILVQDTKQHYTYFFKKPMAPTILERGLPICGLRPNMYMK
jgi:hypothetical protein